VRRTHQLTAQLDHPAVVQSGLQNAATGPVTRFQHRHIASGTSQIPGRR
jgi:hypothetical protein